MFWFLIATAAVLIFIFQFKNRKRDEYWKYIMDIPGPRSLPIIGTEYHLDTSEEIFDRDRDLCKQYYPIYKTFTFGVAFVNIIHPEDMELVLNNTKHIEKSVVYSFLHDWLGSGLLTSTGSKWHKRRKILTPAFHFNILQEFVDVFNKETANLLENLKNNCHKPYIDVAEPITAFTLYSIGETSLGKDLRQDPKCAEYHQAVHDYGDDFVNRIVRPWLHIPFIYRLSPSGRSNKKTIGILHEFSKRIIEERNKHYRDNKPKIEYPKKRLALLDLMLKYKYSGAELDDEGIREEVDTFIMGGHDTAAVSLCYTLMELANNQDIQNEIFEEILSVVGPTTAPTFTDLGELKFMEMCIKESLRLYPSAPVISRVAGEDIKTKTGHIIPKGCNINLFIFDMHRRPDIWENPNKFDPDRFLIDNVINRHPFAYIPFSAGSRNCIGQKYAMLEIKAALCGILRNFKLEPVTKPKDLKYKSSIVLRPAVEIKIKFVPRT